MQLYIKRENSPNAKTETLGGGAAQAVDAIVRAASIINDATMRGSIKFVFSEGRCQAFVDVLPQFGGAEAKT